MRKVSRGDAYQLGTVDPSLPAEKQPTLAYITTVLVTTAVGFIDGVPQPIALEILTEDRFRGTCSSADLNKMLRKRVK